jgi:hypothetical protein
VSYVSALVTYSCDDILLVEHKSSAAKDRSAESSVHSTELCTRLHVHVQYCRNITTYTRFIQVLVALGWKMGGLTVSRISEYTYTLLDLQFGREFSLFFTRYTRPSFLLLCIRSHVPTYHPTVLKQCGVRILTPWIDHIACESIGICYFQPPLEATRCKNSIALQRLTALTIRPSLIPSRCGLAVLEGRTAEENRSMGRRLQSFAIQRLSILPIHHARCSPILPCVLYLAPPYLLTSRVNPRSQVPQHQFHLHLLTRTSLGNIPNTSASRPQYNSASPSP